ncbi:MAG: histidine phosphatase family protein [Pseudomonadota bacterium]
MKWIWMASFLLLGACASTVDQAPSEETGSRSHQIYLVRHAEKQAGLNPSLTTAGQARAERLADILADKGLTEIHSTNLKRTLETAAPIAARTGLPVSLYEANDLDAFAETLAARPGVHLVVGHSNTTPPLAAALGGNPGDEIDEASEYDRLYVITLGVGEVTSKIERFGVRYTAAAPAE